MGTGMSRANRELRLGEQGADVIAELVGGRRVIVASNRGPVEFAVDGRGRQSVKRGSGGVVTALAGLARSLPLTWVAAAMSEGDREVFPDEQAPAREVSLGRQKLHVRYATVAPEVFARSYDVISNQVLWFLQHYLWDPAHTPSFTEEQIVAWDQGYRPLNRAIAALVADEAAQHEVGGRGGAKRGRRAGAQENDGSDVIVLLQDYHLYLAAAFVRERLPRATIEQFIHIPWPTVRYWQLLPDRLLRELYAGLAANDVLGFQTEQDARLFLECARVFLPDARVDLDTGRLIWRRRRVVARAYPITVDGDEARRTLASAAGRLGAQELAPYLGDERQVIVRVDRVEPTKNIVRGFLAYEALLKRRPELLGQVRFLAFMVPSRGSLRVYRAYEREVKRVIQRINGRYGTDDWEPITAYFENNRARALVALRRADVVLVNPVIDGMNLVVKEAAVVNERHAVLLLSRTAGAYEQLAEAVLPVTPTDIEETQEQLYEALTMSEHERRQRAELARAIVERDTLADWAAQQLRDAAHAHPLGGGARGQPLAHAG